jgi:hypothetical protein
LPEPRKFNRLTTAEQDGSLVAIENLIVLKAAGYPDLTEHSDEKLDRIFLQLDEALGEGFFSPPFPEPTTGGWSPKPNPQFKPQVLSLIYRGLVEAINRGKPIPPEALTGEASQEPNKRSGGLLDYLKG